MPGSRLILCRPRSLPAERRIEAARVAMGINPANAPDLGRLMLMRPGFRPTPRRIAVVTNKYWGKGGVRLTVGFMDGGSKELRARILLHLNAWSKSANVKFVASQGEPDVRIARVDSPPEDAGYWSHLGTDIRGVARDQPTMNLEGFTMRSPESEFRRVVRHEAGHTLGFDHEHLRRELVAKIDPAKAIASFAETDEWTAADTREQVLTPLEERSIRGTRIDPLSIMCYDIPAEITFDNTAIVGGVDINKSDYAFAAKLYPKPSRKAPKTRPRTKSSPKR